MSLDAPHLPLDCHSDRSKTIRNANRLAEWRNLVLSATEKAGFSTMRIGRFANNSAPLETIVTVEYPDI
jgi:hypothetical protein